MNKYPLLSKVLLITALMLLLAVPMSMVRDVINERSENRSHATEQVARASAGAQTLIGPVLHVPYTETWPKTVKADDGRPREELVSEQRVMLKFPVQMDSQATLSTEQRRRGIFPVTVFTSQHSSSGRFVWSEIVPQHKGGQITLGQPRLLMGVSDLRGLQSAPELRLAGQPLRVGQAPAGERLPLPLAASLDPALLLPGATLPFSLKVGLLGTGSLAWVPLADETTVSLTSTWPDPSFGGSFLPRQPRVSAEGFEARWQVPSLSTQAQQQFAQRLGKEGKDVALDQFSVTLADAVDVYRLNDRATKYASMFIVLSFAAFFVLEVLRRWRIHPMQYLMVGAALVLFFLLLLSISEHLDFVVAYAIASLACIALQTHYLRHVLGGWRPALVMGGLLSALYGVLCAILVSEDNALMMGSLLLLGVLAAIMGATRKLDWYGVMGTPAPVAHPAPAQ